ncbi:hypothetical protein HS125_19290 [bacterium]|nr:hypothetical protein [bacterium]
MSALLSARRAEELIESFSDARVGVVGDVSLDIEISGRVRRLSPEAPVPVVENPTDRMMLGCAGNVAHNVLTLGAGVSLLGLVGEDAHGEEMRALLSHFYAADPLLVVDPERTTTTKTRIVAAYHGQAQHLVRIDRESRQPISPGLRRQLLDALRDIFPRLSVLVIDDYGKGIVTSALVAELVELRGAFADVSGWFPILVDPKSPAIEMDRGVDWLTPNHYEVAVATGVETDSPTVGGGGAQVPGADRGGASARDARWEGMSLFVGTRRASTWLRIRARCST